MKKRKLKGTGARWSVSQLGAIMAAALVAQGCVMGQVKNPEDDTGIVGTVSAYAVCEGEGCTGGDGVAGWHVATTNHEGEAGSFVYSAYGSPRAYLSPAPSSDPDVASEALELHFEAPGFTGRTVYHRPKYEKVVYEGQEYLYTQLPRPVYLCPNEAIDSDHDGLCDVAEGRYGTYTDEPDSDHDGFSDPFELFGSEGLDLASYGANPLHRDVFVELDYYPGHLPAQGVLDNVVAAYAAAPLSNPDLVPGIALHIFVDQQIADADADLDLNPYTTEFPPIMDKYFHKPREHGFHYGLLALKHSAGNSSGFARTPGNYFVVTLPATADDMGKAGTMMHELGHNLGLQHGGQEGTPFKPNYFSVMNYNYQFSGVQRQGLDQLDYSRVAVAGLSEASLSETAAMTAVAPTMEGELADYQPRICVTRRSASSCAQFGYLAGNARENLDFTRNGSVSLFGVSADLDGDGIKTAIFNPAQRDWSALVYTGFNGEIGDAGMVQAASAPTDVTCASPPAP